MEIEITVAMFGNPSSEFFIADQELESMLKDTLNGEPSYWPFRLDSLDNFCEKIERLFVVSNGGFTFQATWQGNPTTETVSLSIADFLQTIRRNQLKPTTKYVVIGTL
ncbi:MAG: hypothetical protein AB8B95_02600 [Pseudohongiellaceae bacterium]